MFSPRFTKLRRDLGTERGRLALMLGAIVVSLSALGAVLGAWAVLTREIGSSYASSRPAHATLELPGGVDSKALASALEAPGVAEAEAREVLLSRIHVGKDWRPLLLFVAPDFDAVRVNRFTRESGAWPPPLGTLLLERSALGMADAHEGDSVEIKTPNGAPSSLRISGIVHDAGLAPAWQEREVYGYATRETLRALDRDDRLHELRVRFEREPETVDAAGVAARELGQWLKSHGTEVSEVRVPPPRQHPHQRQMATVLLLLVTFAALSLLLASVLVATSLNAMLARQVREIGVMKTLGARTRQLFALYAALIGGLCAVAVLIAFPLGVAGAGVGARAVATMLNFNLGDQSVPAWVFVVQAVSGIALPLGMAFFPINRATRASVRDCIDAHGVVQVAVGSARLPSPIRNLLRRPKRLALTLLLLASGGALFVAALSVARAWERNLDKMRETRHYDVEVRLHQAAPAALNLATVPGVQAAEWWGYAPAAFARDGQIDTVRTYPDRGHGSLTLLAPPPATPFISFPLLAGRWLRDGDTDDVVLNHVAAAQGGGLRVGAGVLLSANGHTRQARVVGIVEEVGAAGVVYMTLSNFSSNYGEARLARASTRSASPSEREAVIRRLERALASSGASVEAVIPFAELRTAVGDHVIVLVRALAALAAVLALVGLLGLASAVTTGILERTREIGVMKALGASRSRILRMVLSESLLTATLSAVLALLITLPVTAGIESMIGRLGFLAPLPFVISLPSVAIWLGLVGVASLAATWLPAQRAAAIPVRRALSEL